MKFYVMDQTGHSTLEFDSANKAEVESAMAKFKVLLGDGHVAAVRKAGAADYAVTRQFDLAADETLFVPQMKGG
jgi:hypothetical protein